MAIAGGASHGYSKEDKEALKNSMLNVIRKKPRM